MCLAKSDQTFKHAHRLAVFAHSRVLTEELVILIQHDFRLFTHHWFDHFLHELNVSPKFVDSPCSRSFQATSGLMVVLYTAILNYMIGLLNVVLTVMVVKHDENQIEPT
jgi:hypothetical protein